MMNIRAEKSDLASIQILMDELNAYREKTFSKETQPFHQRVQKHLPLAAADFDNSILFVAKENQKVIGFIQGSIASRPNHQLSKLGLLMSFLYTVNTVERAWLRNY